MTTLMIRQSAAFHEALVPVPNVTGYHVRRTGILVVEHEGQQSIWASGSWLAVTTQNEVPTVTEAVA